MKLSVHENILGKITLSEKVAWLGQNGFSCIDIVGDAEPAKVKEINRLCANEPVEVATVYGRLGRSGLLAETARERATGVDLLKRRIDLAAAVGAINVIVVPVFGEPQLKFPPEKVVDVEKNVLLAILSEVAPYAGEAGVNIVLEPLNRGETHLLKDPAVAVQVCQTVDHPRVKMMVDTYHMDLESQDMAEQMKNAADWVGLVHLSDRNRMLPGTSGIDFAPFLAAARAIGYDGYFGFEGKPAPNLTHLAEAGQKMQQLWQEA